MARPRGGTSRRQSASSSGTSSRGASQKGGGTGDSWGQRLGQAIWAWVSGPAGQQIVSLIVIALGVVTFITLIPGINSGAIIGAWVRFLVFAFGWAAYPVAAMITGLGLLWLRHLVHRVTAWRWRPFLGFELALIGLQTLTYALINQQSWRLVESGKGGGVIGWALFLFLSDYFGPLITGVVMALVVVLGIALALDLTYRDLQTLGHRLSEVWQAWRAQRAANRAIRQAARKAQAFDKPSETYSPAAGVAVSQMGRTPVPLQSLPSGAEAAESGSRSRETRSKPKIHQQQTIAKPRRTKGSLHLAPLSLLRESRTAGMDPQEIEHKSQIIEKTLEQFGVPTQVTEVRPGPTVTQFGVSPGYISRGADGGRPRKVRVSQIASLADDLALALAASSLRVEAPVPGRAVVGIEVPNAESSLVGLRAVLESEAFHKCGKPLCFAVGLDVAGGPQVADLSRMPHLLVAGTTGSGKSVFV
ncbi:MAG: DNA translocase FtsK 4TM domain-containing protein, partial [Anaerolineae bacterium]|nr:DNA translocase FtsK 4TM domain-containing protein [Anaerolineae bacterium]